MTAHLAQESPITPQLVAAAAVSLSEPRICEGVLHWLETRPAQGGRVTLLRNTAAGTAEVTPEPYSVRSRVHEYGGGAYLPVAEAPTSSTIRTKTSTSPLKTAPSGRSPTHPPPSVTPTCALTPAGDA